MAKFSRYLSKKIKDKYGVAISPTTVRDICVECSIVSLSDGTYRPTIWSINSDLIQPVNGLGDRDFYGNFAFTDAGVDFVYGQYIDDYGPSNYDYLYDDVARKTEDPKKLVITDSKKNLRFHTNIESSLESVDDYPDDIHFVSISNKIYLISKEEGNIFLKPVDSMKI